MAKWLQHGANILIFDEPTQGIDVAAKAEIYRLVRDLAALGKSIVFISSEFAELVEVCDRVLTIREGKVVGELVDDEINETDIVRLAYSAV
jgi:ABC-type sugar transport system ATPase subunit